MDLRMIELKINGSKSPPLANRRLFRSGGERGGPSTLCIEVENCVSGLNKLRLLSHRTTVSVLSHIGSKSPWPTTRISTRSLRKRPTNNPCCFHAVFSVLCHMRIIGIFQVVFELCSIRDTYFFDNSPEYTCISLYAHFNLNKRRLAQ